jgi:hypothetical protein
MQARANARFQISADVRAMRATYTSGEMAGCEMAGRCGGDAGPTPLDMTNDGTQWAPPPLIYFGARWRTPKDADISTKARLLLHDVA